MHLDDSNLSFTNCHEITKMGPDLHALFPDYRLTGGSVCDHYSYFVYNGQSMNLSAEQDGSDTKTTIGFPVTFAGDNFVSVVPIQPQSPLTLAVFIFGSAIFLTFATGTPGKRLLGLSIEPDAAFPRLLKRDVIRNLPLIVWEIAELPNLFSLGAPSTAAVSFLGYVQIATLISATILAVFLWLIPLIRWRGAMPHDRVTGLLITRAWHQHLARPSVSKLSVTPRLGFSQLHLFKNIPGKTPQAAGAGPFLLGPKSSVVRFVGC